MDPPSAAELGGHRNAGLIACWQAEMAHRPWERPVPLSLLWPQASDLHGADSVGRS
jgi:hypothetical protein